MSGEDWKVRALIAEQKVRWLEIELMRARGMKVFYISDPKEAAPGGNACQSSEQHIPETTPNDEQPP